MIINDEPMAIGIAAIDNSNEFTSKCMCSLLLLKVDYE